MPTLHIEHEITGFAEWKTAFNRFADARKQAGVRSHAIRRPVTDPCYIIIDLEFDTTDEAREFLDVLREKVWSSEENAPALVGTPQTRIETLESSEG